MARFLPLARRVLVLTTAAVLGAVAPLAAAPQTFVSMLSDPGDWVGLGNHRLFYPGNASITVTGDAGFLTITVSGGNLGDQFTLQIAAPPGEPLRPGLYVGAQRALFREAGRPGLDIYGDGRGCNRVGGRFDVKDIQRTSTGRVRRLWLTYEQHCENLPPALFGEVRIAVPASPSELLVVPRSLWFPDVDRGTSSTVVPVTVVGSDQGEVSISSTAVGGLHAGDFSVRLDECTGLTLLPGEACQVWLRFTPRAAGPRTAHLVIVDAAGPRYRVPLDAVGIGGRTRFLLDSDPGDFIGQGQQYAYTVANADFVVRGGRTLVGARIDGADGSSWFADFAAPDGDILVPGTRYTGVLRYPFNGTAPGMDVSGNGRGCNTLTGTFEVTALSIALDGSFRHFGVTFEQHCDGEAPALRGTLEYRVPVGDRTPPPPVSSVAAIRDAEGIDLSWTNPTTTDLAFTMVRFLVGRTAPGAPSSGRLVIAGKRTTARINIGPAQPVAIAFYTVDRAGNVGRRIVNIVEPVTPAASSEEAPPGDPLE